MSVALDCELDNKKRQYFESVRPSPKATMRLVGCVDPALCVLALCMQMPAGHLWNELSYPFKPLKPKVCYFARECATWTIAIMAHKT